MPRIYAKNVHPNLTKARVSNTKTNTADAKPVRPVKSKMGKGDGK
jgi:hypothetical protein